MFIYRMSRSASLVAWRIFCTSQPFPDAYQITARLKLLIITHTLINTHWSTQCIKSRGEFLFKSTSNSMPFNF